MVHFQCPCCQAVLCVENAAEARKAVCARCGQQLLAPESHSSPRSPRTRTQPTFPRRTVAPTMPRPRPVASGPTRSPFVPPEDVLYSADIELPREELLAPPPPVAPPPPATSVAPPPPVAPRTLRFPAVPYRPEGGFALGSVPKLFAILLLGAVLVGWLASFVGRWYYVILLYPLIMGIVLAFIGFYAVHKSKIRSPGLAGFAGLIAALVAIATMHYSDYRHARKQVHDSDAPLPANVRFALTQQPRFEVYMVTTAQTGFRVAGENDVGFQVGPGATWAYWGAELLLVAILTMVATRSEASAPFCSECGMWKEERLLGRLRGQGRDVVHACRRGELAGLNEHGVADRRGEMAVSAWVCPRCSESGPIDVQVEQSGSSARQAGTPAVLHLTYPGEALPVLEDLFNSRRAA